MAVGDVQQHLPQTTSRRSLERSDWSILIKLFSHWLIDIGFPDVRLYSHISIFVTILHRK